MSAAFATIAGAAVLGFAGSAHCVAMCGGIAGLVGLSSPAAARMRGRPVVHAIAYNAGRVTSYAIAGAIVATLAAGALPILCGTGATASQLAAASVAGHDSTLAAAHVELEAARVVFATVAALLVVAFGLRLATGGRGFGWIEKLGARAWRRLSPLTRRVFPVTNARKAYAAGMLWGWLPCGMAYSAVLLAGATADPLAGFATMLAFGLGTVPALLFAGALGPVLRAARLRTVAGLAMVALGLGALAAPWLTRSPESVHAHHATIAATDTPDERRRAGP